MSVIKELWHGKIMPQERTFCANKEFVRIRKQLQEEYNLLANELSKDGKIHLENYERLLVEIQSICDEENFIEAFRLGVKIMIEVFKE